MDNPDSTSGGDLIKTVPNYYFSNESSYALPNGQNA